MNNINRIVSPCDALIENMDSGYLTTDFHLQQPLRSHPFSHRYGDANNCCDIFSSIYLFIINEKA